MWPIEPVLPVVRSPGYNLRREPVMLYSAPPKIQDSEAFFEGGLDFDLVHQKAVDG